MDKIKTQIQSLEAAIEKNKLHIQQYGSELRQRLTTPQALSAAMFSGLVFGFFLGHKKTSAPIRHALRAAPLWVKKWLVPIYFS